MRKFKFLVTLYSPSEAYLRKQLVDKGFIPEKVERAKKTKKQKLVDYLDAIIAENEGYTTEQIADAVLKQVKVDGDVFLDNVVLNKKRKEYLTVVDKFEMTITTKAACEMAGIK